jgi:hypothetical protein
MTRRRIKLSLLPLISFVVGWRLVVSPPEFAVPNVDGMRWWKGNTHTHTTMSDGDSPPEVVVQWYKQHGYNFLVLSDHNVFTDPKKYAALNDSGFLLISGEELTTRAEQKPVHINGLNIPHVLEPRTDSTILGTIQKNVDAVRAVEGVPHINHPNFGWALDHEILMQVERDKLLEIFNGHPLVHNWGGGGKPSVEEIWDHLLSRGKRIYGIAVDDAHHFQGEFAPDRSNPGRGWIAVRARSLKAEEIMTNLEAGLFYASTGVVLEDVTVTPSRISIVIRQRSDFLYTTEFIGPHGKVLARVEGPKPEYELKANVGYVRARVRDSGGAMAWVQPVFTQP